MNVTVENGVPASMRDGSDLHADGPGGGLFEAVRTAAAGGKVPLLERGTQRP